jgi:hypothetical protein
MVSRPSYGAAISAYAAALAFPALAAPPTIDTYSGWNKTSSVSFFGCTGSPTYGQVFTVPSGQHHLTQVTFWLQNYVNSGSMVVRAHVYKWDAANAKIQGQSVYDSTPRTISFPDTKFHPENFFPNSIAVSPGARYVIFVSIDWEYVHCISNSYDLAWAATLSDVYPGGGFVYINDGGDDLRWSTPWNTTQSSYDLAFKAYLMP